MDLKNGQVWQLLWTKSYGGDQNDYFKNVIQTRDGGFLATGSTGNSTATSTDGHAWAVKTDADGNITWSYILDMTPSVLQRACQTDDGGYIMVASVNVSGSEARIIVIRITAAGTLQWMKSYSNGSSDYGYFIREAIDGQILVSGFVYGMGAGMHDGFLMKISGKDGNLRWLKTYGSPGNDVIDCFAENANGDLLMSMNWRGNGDNQASIVKVDTSGKMIWAREYNFPFPTSRGYTIKLSPDSGIVLSVSDAITHQGGAVLKTDKDGNPLWAYDYHPSGTDKYSQFATDELKSRQGFYITGYTNNVGYLTKTDQNGKAGTCVIKAIQVNMTPISPVSQDHTWDIIEPVSGWEPLKVASYIPVVTATYICPTCCIASNTTIDTSICDGELYTLPDNTTVNKTGTYAVKFTSASGCDSIITTNLTVNSSYHIRIQDSICPHEQYRLPDGSVADTAGTFISHLQTKSGCDSIVTTEVSFRSMLSIQYVDSICDGSTLTLPNGRTVSDAGTFRDTLPSAISCDTIATYHIGLKRPPVISLGKDTCIFPGQKLSLNPGKGYPFYEWQNGSTASTQNVSLPGKYKVKVSNECGTAVDSILVTTDCLPTIFIPSAFSPNGDGINDIFRILNIHGQKLVSFNIWDRWGKNVFHTRNIGKGWDGRFKGQPQQTGGYVYFIKIINLSGKVKLYRGSVLLIR